MTPKAFTCSYAKHTQCTAKVTVARVGRRSSHKTAVRTVTIRSSTNQLINVRELLHFQAGLLQGRYTPRPASTQSIIANR
ncbi:hypothetical protein BELL_1056g00010 [Botrytis elliptica]|uniref:Uncharacterized protein n=1 Tax=Botrytis elliptica TaxID=278938 RepID=A0A4Z1IRB9_9HELO|nr:hypothetical protein BELL_1056g00010 [Botrytis elliptica]